MKKSQNGSDVLSLWHSIYNQGVGFRPKVAPIRIVFEHPPGRHRKLTKIVPYSLPEGGFAVMVPYHHANEGMLSKEQVFDSLSRSLILPRPKVVKAYSVSSKAKLSFHSNGMTQFSSMDGKIISGIDSTTGEFKGLGIKARPFLQPSWSGPTFAVQAWGLDGFEECKLGKSDIVFTYSELRNPYKQSSPDAVRMEIYVHPRWKPLASVGYFPDYRATMRGWNPNSRLFVQRPVRLVALHSPEAALVVLAAHFPHVFDSASGFSLSSPRDAQSYGLYATYPLGDALPKDGSLDYEPIQVP
jgi:hypothetical protein